VARGTIARTSGLKALLSDINSSQDRSANLVSDEARPRLPPGESLVLAGLLTLGGLAPTPAADAASMASDRLACLLPELFTALAKVGISSLHQTAAEGSSTWFPLLEKLSTWAYLHRHAMLAFTSKSPKTFRMHGSKLSFSDHAAIIATRELWAGLPSIGFKPLLIYSKLVAPSARATCKYELQCTGIVSTSTAITRQKYAAMRFCPCTTTERNEYETDGTFSNHQMGKTGRLVVAAMTLAILLAKKELL
jgi:hypothetical protein